MAYTLINIDTRQNYTIIDMAVYPVLKFVFYCLTEYEDDSDDSDTEMEDESAEPVSSRSEPKSILKTEPKSTDVSASNVKLSVNKSRDIPKPVASARSPGAAASASRARADFFTSPPEPLRLDPFKMFGMERKNPITPKEEPESQSSTNDKPMSPSSEVADVESDEATDSQVSQ